MSQAILSGTSVPQLALRLSQASGLDLLPADISSFPNQELRIRVQDYADSTYVIQSFAHPVNSHIIELLLLADAVKRMGATQIAAIIPWFGYSKQDKVFLPGEPLSVKVIARMLQAVNFQKIITLDLHNPSIAGYFDIPVVNLSAMQSFAQHARNTDLSNTMVVSPDAGAVKTATKFAKLLEVDICHLNKHRDLLTGEVEIIGHDTDINDKDLIIIDDMIATGGTMIATSEYLKDQGAKEVTIYATHHLFIDGVQEKLDQAPIDHLIISDSITSPTKLNSKTEVISIAPLIAEAIS